MSEFLVALVSGTFLLSAVGKFSAPHAAEVFAGQVGIPSRLARPAVMASAAAEFATSVCLYAGWGTRAALTVSAVLAVGFVLVQVAGLRAHTTPCRCFGKLDADLSPDVSLFRAVAVAVIALAAVWRSQGGAGAFDAQRWLASIFGAATLIVCFHLFDEVRKFRRIARASHEALLAAGREREAKHVAA